MEPINVIMQAADELTFTKTKEGRHFARFARHGRNPWAVQVDAETASQALIEAGRIAAQGNPMNIRYAQLTVSINGIDTDSKSLEALRRIVRRSIIREVLAMPSLRFRNEFDDDVLVEIEETTGEQHGSDD